MFALSILTVVLLTFIYYFLRNRQEANNSKLPPCSWHFPILGHLPRLGTSPHKTLLKFGEAYGPIFSIKFGSYPTVVINDGDLIKKAFNLPSLTGRPRLKFLTQGSKDRAGFVLNDGAQALHSRGFIQKMLKDFGYGGKSMELKIVEQLPSFLEVFQTHCEQNKPLDVHRKFAANIVAYIWSILMSEEVQEDDQWFKQFSDALFEGSRFTILMSLSTFIPKLEEIFPSLFSIEKNLKPIYRVHSFLLEQAQKHDQSRVRGQPRDVMDGLLDRYDEIKSDGASEWFVPICLFELISASIETNSTMLEWIIYYCVKHPETQRKLQKEIDVKIGTSRHPCLNDRAEMPFAEAIIEEALRISSPLPLSLFHSALEDTMFQGYLIPKDTLVIGNVYAANNDPKIWTDPEKFKPERFLDAGGTFKRDRNTVSFSVGRRMCIGEHLARSQLFLYVVGIFQKFELSISGKLPNNNGTFGVTLCVNPYSVIVKSRNKS